MTKGLIIGYGVVGSNLDEELKPLKMDVVDKYKAIDTRKEDYYDVAFVCVDTPYTDKRNTNDVTEVWNAIEENDADLYVIKSTILPGTTEKIRKETNKRVIFSPEYYGGTQHANNYDFNFTILGGEDKDCNEAIHILQKVYDGRHSFRKTDSKTAELVKYMENSWLATKVSFMHQFSDVADQLGVSFETLRELFILDPRVNPSHTFVYKDHPYWDSHCLNKDVPAIADEYDMILLKSVVQFNDDRKNEYELEYYF